MKTAQDYVEESLIRAFLNNRISFHRKLGKSDEEQPLVELISAYAYLSNMLPIKKKETEDDQEPDPSITSD